MHVKKLFIFQIKIEIIFVSLVLYNFLHEVIYKNRYEKKNIKIALCTMGKMENLYAKEFIEYYLKMGVDHIFIYDDNEPDTEKIYNSFDNIYLHNITIYEAKKIHIDNQSLAFSECYQNNANKFDWFLMVDMDEYLYIVDGTLKEYLTDKRFNKCDFIKINWVVPTDNDLIYYDSRPLFERFRPPYIKFEFVKSIIRGNISNLKYSVHSPYISPERNITCNNVGKRIYYKDMNFESLIPINIKMSYIIHFRFKSTEEFINKIKRGYSNWYKDSEKFLIDNINVYFENNNATPEKIKYIEEELNLNLSHFIKDINKKPKNKKIYKKFFRFFR